jgi:enoyl-CoA hydratase/carnithine racemase
MTETGGRVDIDDQGTLRVVTLRQPNRKNALTPAMLDQLVDAMVVPDHTRVVVLRGAAGDFSSGFDLNHLGAGLATGLNPIEAAADAIECCAVPVVAEVDGVCMGGAVELCAAATYVVAGPRLQLRIPAATLGIVYPLSGMQRMRLAWGTRTTTMLLTSAATLDAPSALRLGIVDEVVTVEPWSHARRWADQVAAGAPSSVRITKALLRLLERGADVHDVVLEGMRQRVLQGGDANEGVLAARQKRTPQFPGA